MTNVRELFGFQYDSRGYTDENSLAKLMLTAPDKINNKLTYLWGRDSAKFPLHLMTEGQGASGIFETNDVQYYWDIMGRMKHTEEVISVTYGTSDKPGLNNTPFYVTFKSNWLIPQYGLIAPDGITQVRIMAEPTRVGDNYVYELELKTTDPTAYCDVATNLVAGLHWVMSAPTVPESKSRGNRSNAMAPGRMVNQISFNRYTKTIAGNAANKVTKVEFDVNGTTTNRWINEEMRQFEIDMRQMNEEHLMWSLYNRDTNGVIMMKDRDNNEPIPEGAGIWSQVKDFNYDTYGYNLTVSKLSNTITDVLYADTDTGKMDIVLYGGLGFLKDFDAALKAEGATNNFTFKASELTIGGAQNGRDLTYGAYYSHYKDITGHSITVKQMNIFDFGIIAEMQKKNGEIHPRTGLPMISHSGLFLDHSTYNGERNIKMVQMKGQSVISGVIKGLSPIPDSWGVVPTNSFANDKDESSYEKKFSKGVMISNATRCFLLQCSL